MNDRHPARNITLNTGAGSTQTAHAPCCSAFLRSTHTERAAIRIDAGAKSETANRVFVLVFSIYYQPYDAGPSGAKARIPYGPNGTAEAVPFPARC
jgi:hypothetical protein